MSSTSYTTPKIASDSAVYKEEDTVTYIQNRDPNRPLSRYNKIRFLLSKKDNLNNIEAYPIQETWDPLTIAEYSTDSYLEVPPEFDHRPDLIARKYYGNEHLYWIIAYANKMIDPFAETYIGRKLILPSRETIFQDILAKQ